MLSRMDSKLKAARAAAALLGRLGGLERAKRLSASRRKAIAVKAAATRWDKRKTDKG